MVILEDDVSRPFGRDFGYPIIAVVLQDRDERAHLVDVFCGGRFEPGNPGRSSAVVAVRFTPVESLGNRKIVLEPGQQTLQGSGDPTWESIFSIYSASPSPPFCAASGENSQRSGLRSISGVSSRQSSPRTRTVLPSMPTNFTIEVPIGLGRTGERSENVPR